MDKIDVIKQSRGRRVRYIRESVFDLTRDELGEKSGIPSGTLTNWETVKNQGLTEKGASRFIQFLLKEGISCSLEWLLYGGEPSPIFLSTGKKITAASEQVLQSSEEENITKELKCFCEHNENPIHLMINDNSMLPVYWPGDLLAGNRYYGEAIKKLIGLPCIVELNNGLVLTRMLEIGEAEGFYDLCCLSPEAAGYEHANVRLISAAPVLWLRRKKPLPI